LAADYLHAFMLNKSSFVNKNKKFIIRIAVFLFLFGVSLTFSGLANAQIDVGVNEINNDIVLSSGDPRTIAARVINIVMLVLGVLAVGLIIYGGFIWMTSNGAEDKIEKAKKILKNSVIGLVIILSAWGIASFILSRLTGATNGNGSSGSSCNSGQLLSCGCGGSMSCIDGSWGPCLGSDCNNGGGPSSCDSSPLSGCQAADQICSVDSFCDVDICSCLPKGELGDYCDADTNTPTCEADNNKCAEYLSCNPDSCTCYGPPVITNISPAGGFCNENVDLSCTTDADCSLGCNLNTPNGTADNIITISGSNFGQYDPLVSKVIFSTDAVGLNPTALNPDCIDSWTNNQIIVVVPNTATTGAVRVVTADNQSDSTNDDNGPIIEDFVVNSIVRPGVCLLTPDSGLLSEKVNYRGVNLYGGEAYFGSYDKNVRGLASDFINPTGLTGTTTIPNVNKGEMSSFVVASIAGNNEKSNYVRFVKQAEPNQGPYISYFEPSSGRAGQYVTIHGSGFGGARGSSRVFFGDKEASYDFPEVCASSVWKDNQVIVKVPADINDGNYVLRMEINDDKIDSQNANPNVFTVDANSSLKTSICRIFPTRGQIGTPVEIWGEYFGDNGGNALTVFSYNRSVSGQISLEQSAQKLNPSVPDNAVTGAVKVVKNSEWGNDVNFEIGTCVDNSDCSGDTCCPAGTYKQGRCATSLAECYVDIPNSVFEWNFSTEFGGVEGDDEFDSCQGMAQALGACQVGAFCPNSPGLCSPYAGGTKVLGSCDSSCATVPACAELGEGTCVYDHQSDRCFINNNTCSLDSNISYTLGQQTFNAVQSCKIFSQFGGQAHWQISVASSCPNGWTRLDGGHCVDSTSSTESTCSLCPTNFNCRPIGQEGRCVSAELCPGSASCDGTSCLADTSARCDCCCEIGQDARDCCLPLTCSGTCGSDTSDDKAGLGQCSGCMIDSDGNGTISPEEQLLSDQACNCSAHSGKYCDISVPTGACVDCSRLSVQSCLNHSQSCCLDSKGTASPADDVCRGGNGQEVSADPASPDFGYCAYYDCQNASSTPPGDPSLCASSTPKVFGLFKNVEACVNNCAASPGLSFCGQFDGDLVACAAANGCCFNFNDQKCTSGAQMLGGYCAYYNCQAAPNEAQCDPNPSPIGIYNSQTACSIGCVQPPFGGLGKDCRNLTTNNTDCNQSFCSPPFACLNGSGNIGLPGDCGACCCQVGNPDSCSGIGNGSLVCQSNQTPCSGEDRGLCCGCSQDVDCGNANTLGCDASACCRNRPSVLGDQLVPPHGATGVCRNASIRVPFDQLMDVGSVMDNILLLEEHDYGNGVCPAGTFLASVSTVNTINHNWLAKAYSQVKSSFRSILNRLGLSSAPVLALNPPAPDKLYCSIPGNISVINNGNGSVAEFIPKKLLSPATNYYLIVKGDESLDSNAGVLSQWQIGLNGPGYLNLGTNSYIEGENIKFNNLTFKNSYIAGFTTLPQQGANVGICAVDYVVTEPASYLFQSTDNDLNEDDSNPNSNSFDTKNDRDKLFKAGAYSADDQLLHPSSGYYWDWSWQVAKPSIASIAYVSGLADNQAFVVAADGVSDDSTILSAQIDMNRFSAPNCNSSASCVCAEPECVNNCCNIYQEGDGLQAETPLFIFLCKNPWPAVNPVTLAWSPWYDTCVGAIGNNCSNYNYKFYYCRDAGADGLADDLPAMINPAVIRGTSNSLICSEGQTACSNLGTTCGPDNNYDGVGDGFCIWNILKESYFFKEATPQIGAITAAIDQEDGDSVRLEWYGDASVIYNANASLMGKYRLYYAPVSSGNMSFVDISPRDAYIVGVPGPVCTPLTPANGENYSCHYLLKGLQAGENYRFRISAISSAQVESPLSEEKTVLITDTLAPAPPQGLTATIVNGQRLHFVWQANTDDTSFYRLYHGVSSGQYGESYDSDKQATTMDLNLQQFSQGIHYFALSALDSSNNESNKSAQITIVVPAP